MKQSTCLYNYRFGRFELQPNERRLLAAGVPTVLGPRAFDVLVALVERAGHLVTKEELFSLVWPKLIVEDTNLHVQVSALRKILGPATIATVPGQGYRFTMELTRELVDSVDPVTAARSDPPGVTFTGSERELADVRKLLGEARLLALVGVNAGGKTRLLLQVAAAVMADYPDGVWFVDLAPLRDARQVPQAVASVLGVKEEAGPPVTEVLFRHVKNRRLLLILDNVDHLARACTELTKVLLQLSPHLKLLVSSRDPLHVAGESIYPMPPPMCLAPPIPTFPQTFEAVPNARKQAVRPWARLRRWPWLAGGVAVFLIAAAAAWQLYQTGRATPQTTATAEPPTLSIAILPFAAPAEEQLAATLMPEITAAFWRNGRSARMASPELVAPYQGKHVDARAIGHELNVRYVAEGEIRRAGNTRQLSARLIDATNGAQIWTERLEVPAEELPGTYDALATRVARHIWFALLRAEKERVAHQSPTNLTAIELCLRGSAMDLRQLDGALAARKLFEKALELDPRLVWAMLNIGFTYETELDQNPLADGGRIRKDFDEVSRRAIASDRTDPRAWVSRVMGLYYNNRLEEALEAIAELERIEPNNAGSRGWHGVVLIALGRSEEALAVLDQGLALDPSGPDIFFLLRQKCKAYSYLGQYERAIPICEKSATDQQFLTPFPLLTADYAQLGEMDKAASAKTQLLKLNPGFSIARLTLSLPPDVPRNPIWMHQAETYVIPGLRKAGIPEK
jgi:DNA-binding winged helix-turn-helix (wHTH) protein/TolB-like protein